MDFLLDQNVPKSVGIFLKKSHFSVQWIKEVDQEMKDANILVLAKKTGKIILTNDKDFLTLSHFYPDVDVILFDFLDQSGTIRIKALEKILSNMKQPFGLIILQTI